MRWWQDRRGYGQLRLPYRRRAERKRTWLYADLRRRRRKLLRENWRDLSKIVGAFTVSAAVFVAGLDGHPVLQAGAAGLFAGLMTVSALVFVALMDCSLLSRFGRWMEELVGDELRTTPGVYGVISNLPIAFMDVDHVVLAPEGVYAVEVKTYLVRQRSLDQTHDLPRKRSQAARGAAAVRELLLTAGIDAPVYAVVLLAGPGAPVLEGPDERGRTWVASFRRTGDWRRAGDSRVMLKRNHAWRAAEALIAHRDASLVEGPPGAGPPIVGPQGSVMPMKSLLA